MENKPFSLGIKLKKIESKFSASGTYLECTTGNHNKYYYLYIRDNPNDKNKVEYPFVVIFHFGRIGSEGAFARNIFKTYEEAERYLARKVKQKLEKEYVRVMIPSNPTIY